MKGKKEKVDGEGKKKECGDQNDNRIGTNLYNKWLMQKQSPEWMVEIKIKMQ